MGVFRAQVVPFNRFSVLATAVYVANVSKTPLARKVLGSVNRVLLAWYLIEVLHRAPSVRQDGFCNASEELIVVQTVPQEVSKIELILWIVTLAQTEQLPHYMAAGAYQIAFRVLQIVTAIATNAVRIRTSPCKKMSADHVQTELSLTRAARWGFQNACPVHQT
ncbi:hypothetical protein FGB62_213g05 [Gracilaria domingensis]|nr:hypothetical protein FGB62_213g05 [Gracilaria domingensis]